MRPRPTIRLRLTAWYAALFLASGALLLGLSYAVVRAAFEPEIETRIAPAEVQPAPGTGGTVTAAPGPVEIERRVLEEERRRDERALSDVLGRFAAMLGVLTLGSIVSGWIIAGRALAPVSRITETAQRVSDQSLDQRIALEGPADELKELADTFDAMLDRLETAFEGQRRFVANASHELRTPLAIIRAELEELGDTGMRGEGQAMLANARRAARRSERLIDSLLTLARSDGALARQRVDLAELARMTLHGDRCATGHVDVRPDLQPAEVLGDPLLLESLVTNLVENAVHYNHEGGHVDVAVRGHEDAVELRVANTGPRIDPQQVGRLFEPFARGGTDRVGRPEGAGLGLSIVRAVVAAHGGSVSAVAEPHGGLAVTVHLPPAQS